MPFDVVSKLLADARQVDSQYSKEKISSRELQKAWDAAKVPEAGEPAGKPLTAAEAKLFQDLASAKDLTPSAKKLLTKILGEIPTLLQSGGGTGGGNVVSLPAKRGHQVAIDPSVGFLVDANHGAPADPLAYVKTFFNAGEWLQASFGSNDNLFTAARLDVAGKRAVLTQLSGVVGKDLGSLTAPQREQLLGSLAALTVELIKSVDIASMSATGGSEQKALLADGVALLQKLLGDARLSPLVKRSLVGYLHQSDSFVAKLNAAQKTELDTQHAKLFPGAPVDYAKWDTAKKSVIKIDHVCGAGENFFYGFVKELLGEGVGDARGSMGKYPFKVVRGSPDSAPATLQVTIPASDTALNKWGRDMTIEIDVREYDGDMYKKMSDASVDIVSYGGHSNFGGNTLESLENAPAQKGDKIICRDLCCGVDTKNAEAHQYPDASLNGITSVCSSYFRTKNDPQRGTYANESEGYLMLMALTRGVLGKKQWDGIGSDLARSANWWGHDSSNNWSWPTDPRAGAFLDDDFDGIPNVFDLLPSYNTTDVAASTAREFELKTPAVAADEISGKRAFQALQFVNTATNYNEVLQPLNEQRKLIADPNGMWFDGKDDPKTYVRFRAGKDGKVYAQLSSGLASMSLEALRTVLYVESVRYFAAQNPNDFGTKAERNATALLFAASSLEYDQSYRDEAVFDGLKRMYGFPARLSWSDFRAAVADCEERHNYTGDGTAVAQLLKQYKNDLGGAAAGEPAIAVG